MLISSISQHILSSISYNCILFLKTEYYLMLFLCAVPYWPSGSPIKSMSFEFRDQDVMQNSFAQAQEDNASCSSLIHWCSNSTIKCHQIRHTGFGISEATLVVTNPLLVFHVLWESLQENQLHYFAGHWVRLSDLCFPGCSLSSSVIIGIMFALLQSVRT